jgi:hypothetical protein
MISVRSSIEAMHYKCLEEARRAVGIPRPCCARDIIKALEHKALEPQPKLQLPPSRMPAGIILEAHTDPNLNGFPHLASRNKGAIFVFQTDGNFVLRTPEGKILWSTKTAGSAARVLSVQSDGNLVLRASRDPNAAVVWASNSVGHPNAQLVVQDDGNAVLLDAAGNPYWHTASQGFENRQDEGGFLEDIGDVLEDVGGAALTVLYEASGAATLVNMVNNIAEGVRLDKVISRCVEDAAKNVRDYGPMIVSLVPGIGTGISAAIAGGLALAQGKPIDEALENAAIGALPGGPFIQSASHACVAAARGQPIEQVVLEGIPISPEEQQGILMALQLAQDVAQGKAVKDALIHAADSGLSVLPDDIRKAVQVGTALAQGEKLQKIMIAQIPTLVAPGGPLENMGQQVAAQNSIAAGARNLVAAEAHHGFNVGLGLMQHAASVVELDAARKNLDPENLKAFDMAVALY